MAVELRVPEVGESITEVEIGDWLKAEGERASRDETVVMIDTDKVTVELPAPVTGVITKILVAKGSTAKVGDVIGYMEESAQAAARPGRGSVPPPPPSTRATPAAQPAAPAAPAPAERPAPPPAPPPSPPDGGQRVMPAAARALHDAGLAAADVTGSGPGGRVLKEDVERAASHANAKVPPSPAVHEPEGE